MSRFTRVCASVLAAVLLALSGAAPCVHASSPAAAPWSHAYYLFLSDPPIACEACYVPLLITSVPLESIGKDAPSDCVLITTYERDSIWQINGMVSVAAADLEVAPRIVRVRQRHYRYQEVAPAEVLKLLERPEGTIPISRPMLHSDLPPGPSLDELKAVFSAFK